MSVLTAHLRPKIASASRSQRSKCITIACSASKAAKRRSVCVLPVLDQVTGIAPRIVLMRHAESADVLGVKDHELPITETGIESARKVAEQMQKMGWVPNIVMSSNSLRSKQTFESMKTVIEDLNKADLHFLGSLYTESQLDGHTLPHLMQLLSIEACDDDHICALCLGHNKGWEEAASSLAMDAVNLDHCDAAFFEADGSTWAELLDPDNLEKWTYCNLVKAAAL